MEIKRTPKGANVIYAAYMCSSSSSLLALSFYLFLIMCSPPFSLCAQPSFLVHFSSSLFHLLFMACVNRSIPVNYIYNDETRERLLGLLEDDTLVIGDTEISRFLERDSFLCVTKTSGHLKLKT